MKNTEIQKQFTKWTHRNPLWIIKQNKVLKFGMRMVKRGQLSFS